MRPSAPWRRRCTGSCAPVSIPRPSWRCRFREAQALRLSLVEEGYEAVLRTGDTWRVRLAETILEVVGREDFIAMTAFAGGPVDLADTRTVSDLDRGTLDLELLRRLPQRLGRDAARTVEDLIGGVD